MSELDTVRQAIVDQKAKIVELKNKLNNIRVVMKPLSDAAKLDLEEKQMRAGAEAMMPWDPNTAQTWLQGAENTGIRREQIESKKTADTEKKALQQAATTKYQKALEAWSASKDDTNLRNSLYIAMQELRNTGIPAKDPIEQYIAESQGERRIGITQDAANRQITQDQLNAALAEKRSNMEERRFQLELAKFAEDQKKNQTEMKGEKLSGEAIQKIANLKTVLTSLDEIEGIIGDFNASGITVPGVRDLNYTAKLASENLGRVQSGGAITADELVTFKDLISPGALDIFDRGASYLTRVQKLKNSINGKINSFAVAGRDVTGGTGGSGASNNPPPPPPPATGNSLKDLF